MISCKEATNYISQKEEGKLTLRQRWQLLQHLAICTFCRLFNKQNKIFIKSVPHLHKHTNASLTTQQKESMIAALENS
jgi:flagellar biosynthesis/type III secretory pathway chaperone